MRILRAADYKRMPWKNGGGETVEIAVFPPGASVDDFDWRISMATVAQDGPFSVFDGIDRTLSVLTGEGIALSVDGRETVILRPDSRPHAFPADVPTGAFLLGGPITDLNVMTRRGRSTHRVTRCRTTDGPFAAAAPGPTVILATAACRSETASQGEEISLERLDALFLEPDDGPVIFSDDLPVRLYVIQLEPAGRSSHRCSTS